MIKVSFVVIGYNLERYIERCIKSILSQTILEFEIIFVNDGSTDTTIEIVEKLSKTDNRIKIINQKNAGANAARKTGYNHTIGEYIVFIDGDDWVEIDLAKDMYKLAKKENLDIISYGHYIAYDHLNKKQDVIKRNGNLKEYEYLNLILSGKLSHNLWNKFIKRDFLEKAKFKDIPSITMGDDLAANVRFGVYKPKVLVIEKYYYNYFQNQSSVTRVISPKILEMEETIKDIEKNLEVNNLLNKYTKHIEFIKFRNFYARVVKSKHKDSYITRRLYSNWKKSNIRISDNEICINYIKSKSILENILMYAYNFNYKLGYSISRLYLITNKFKRREL